ASHPPSLHDALPIWNMMSYTRRLIEILDRYVETQSDVLDQVAGRCADAIERKGLIHLYGSGHSAIPTMDAYPRYGSTSDCVSTRSEEHTSELQSREK